INRCIYQEVFKKFGREDLGPILCEYDTIIADNVDQWVRFEREETIADGFPRCTFRFFPIEKKFSNNPIINNIYSFLKILDESNEMLTKDGIHEQGLDHDTDIDEIMKLYEAIKEHPGIKVTITEHDVIWGNNESFERFEDWKKLFNRKLSQEERSKILRRLPLELKEAQISQLISNIIDNPYETDSIKWICLNYLQHHFTARIGFITEGFDEFQLKIILDEFTNEFPKISFGSKAIDNTRVSVYAFGKGIPEYKLKEPMQKLRRKIVIDFPDVSISSIQPILTIDPVAQKFFTIFEDSNQPFQLRELALRILISRVGNKLIPFLAKIAENPDDDIFLRGRAIDSLVEFTGDLPKLEKEIHEMPVPIQRAYIDFIKFYGVQEDLLISIASNDNITPVIRMIALKNLTNYINPQVTEFLLGVIQNRSIDERIRQAALDSVGKHEEISKIESTVINVFTDSTESSFLRMEAFETLKELGYNKQIEFAKE
ncbi:MAG: L-2-amino-thiazoline-4-carboxylic acid hydrolase, partial [Candidatus Kariarchaeaceae archaeon]